jgi:hypothetical protein
VTNAEEYRRMVAALAAGEKWPRETIARTLNEAGKCPDELLIDLHALPLADRTDRPQPGDRCEACGNGRLRITTSRQKGTVQVQRLACGTCGHKPTPNTRNIHRGSVRPRRRRFRS